MHHKALKLPVRFLLPHELCPYHLFRLLNHVGGAWPDEGQRPIHHQLPTFPRTAIAGTAACDGAGRIL